MGKWNTDRAPYQREIMDCFNDTDVEEISIMSSAQIGKTEILNNAVGYFMDQDPSPMMIVFPTENLARAYSKDRLAPMLRDTKKLNDVVASKKRDAENEILHKKFPGGHITMAGSNSPSSLASRPIRVALCDEVDRYEISSGKEGDAIKLTKKRTTTFHNRKLLQVSTPTTLKRSKIFKAYEQSDKRKYYVPCPHCGEYQELIWEQVEWSDRDHLDETVYVCAHNGCIIEESDKMQMLLQGEWRATEKFTGKAGFYINELYSPWVTWGEMAQEFLDCYLYPEQLQTFVNTALAQLWDEEKAGEGIDKDSISSRKEKYEAEVPKDVYLLTCAVDVQDDRLELEVLGWGVHEENWSICYKVLYGDPGTKEIWEELDEIIEANYEHELGVNVKISLTCIDSGGHYTEEVYQYCKKKQKQRKRRVFPIKGSSQRGQPIIAKSKPSKNNDYKIGVWFVGTDTAKETIYSRLGVKNPGPSYMHFPEHYEDYYFEQLTAERKVKTYEKGKSVVKWTKPKSKRNEALDLKVYNFAAFRILKPNMETKKKHFLEKINKISNSANQKSEENNSKVNTSSNSKRGGQRKSFVKSY